MVLSKEKATQKRKERRSKKFIFSDQVEIALNIIDLLIRKNLDQLKIYFKFDVRINYTYSTQGLESNYLSDLAEGRLHAESIKDRDGKALYDAIVKYIDLDIEEVFKMMIESDSPPCRRFAIAYSDNDYYSIGMVDPDPIVRLTSKLVKEGHAFR